jgi:hypothetical protein
VQEGAGKCQCLHESQRAPCHVEAGTRHCCTQRRFLAHPCKARHCPAPSNKVPKCPHLSKAARQATLAAFPAGVSGPDRTWPQLTYATGDSRHRLSAPDRSKAANPGNQRAPGSQEPTRPCYACTLRRSHARHGKGQHDPTPRATLMRREPAILLLRSADCDYPKVEQNGPREPLFPSSEFHRRYA